MTDSIDYLRRRAKLLKRDFAQGNTRAIERVNSVFPSAQALRHTQALHVVALEQGAAS